MSGLMRRIMRPSADDSGQPATEGEAAAPDAPGPIGEAEPGANPFAGDAAPPDAAEGEPTAGEPTVVVPPTGPEPAAAAQPVPEDDKPTEDPAAAAQEIAQTDQPSAEA